MSDYLVPSDPSQSTISPPSTDPKKEVDSVKKYETVVSSGQAALRALFTLNGGATIAFLTFLGHLWEASLSPSGGHALPLSGGGALVVALNLVIYGSFFCCFRVWHNF